MDQGEERFQISKHKKHRVALLTPDQKIANSIPGRPPSGEPLAAQWRGYPIVGQNLVSGLVHMYVPSLCSCANSITISKKLYYFYFKILGKIHIYG